MHRLKYAGLFGLMILALGGARVSAEDRLTPGNESRGFVFNYRVDVSRVPSPESEVKVWIPLPIEDEYQEVLRIGYGEHLPPTIVTEPEYGNRFARFEWGPGKSVDELSMRIEVVRKTVRVEAHDSAPQKPKLDRYLLPDLLVPIVGAPAKEAREVVGEIESDWKRARKLYDNIVSTVSYDKSGEGWGRGDANYACDVRRGNCTDFHSLFISQARSVGIPARFIMGFPLPKETTATLGGYHCWAEFWTDEHGWAPVDASEAQKDLSRRDELFAGLDADRIAFTMGRDVMLPGSANNPHNYLIYPVVEVDGEPFTDFDKKFAIAPLGAR